MDTINTTNGVGEILLEDFKTESFGTGTSGSEISGGASLAPDTSAILHSVETLGANEQPPCERLQRSLGPTKIASAHLDKSLLERAKTTLEDFNINDAMQATIDLGSLRGVVLQLWETAATSTQFHKEILAILEAAVISLESPNEGQLSVLREAIIDLQNDVLAQAHVDVIRRQFINEGFSPLALISEIENGDNSNR